MVRREARNAVRLSMASTATHHGSTKQIKAPERICSHERVATLNACAERKTQTIQSSHHRVRANGDANVLSALCNE